jgi:hypothetical protein
VFAIAAAFAAAISGGMAEAPPPAEQTMLAGIELESISSPPGLLLRVARHPLAICDNT